MTSIADTAYPPAFNHLTGGPLKRDARGRVRFSFQGMRYEVSKSGELDIYYRSEKQENQSPIGNIGWTASRNPKLLRTLADALELAVSP